MALKITGRGEGLTTWHVVSISRPMPAVKLSNSPQKELGTWQARGKRAGLAITLTAPSDAQFWLHQQSITETSAA